MAQGRGPRVGARKRPSSGRVYLDRVPGASARGYYSAGRLYSTLDRQPIDIVALLSNPATAGQFAVKSSGDVTLKGRSIGVNVKRGAIPQRLSAYSGETRRALYGDRVVILHNPRTGKVHVIASSSLDRGYGSDGWGFDDDGEFFWNTDSKSDPLGMLYQAGYTEATLSAL